MFEKAKRSFFAGVFSYLFLGQFLVWKFYSDAGFFGFNQYISISITLITYSILLGGMILLILHLSLFFLKPSFEALFTFGLVSEVAIYNIIDLYVRKVPIELLIKASKIPRIIIAIVLIAVFIWFLKWIKKRIYGSTLLISFFAIYIAVWFIGWIKLSHEAPPPSITSNYLAPDVKVKMDKDGAKRIFMIGIDGGTWKVLSPLIESGQVPNFKKVTQQGAWGILKNDKYGTFESFASIATGKVKEKHGVKEYFLCKFPMLERFQLKGGDLRLEPYYAIAIPLLYFSIVKLEMPDRAVWQARPIWEVLSENAYKVCVVNYPAYRNNAILNGTTISEGIFSSPWNAIVNHKTDYEKDMHLEPGLDKNDIIKLARYPKELNDSEIERFMHLEQKDKDEFRRANLSIATVPPTPLSVIPLCLAMDISSTAITREILPKIRPQFFAIFLETFDAIAHHFWGYRFPERMKESDRPEPTKEEINNFGHTMDAYLKLLDDYLGFVLSQMDDESLLVIVSDHGHGGEYNKFWRIWMHDPDGIVIMYGKNIIKGVEIHDATIFDITPSLLYLAGFPIAKDMDGKIIKEAIDSHFIEESPIRYVNSYR